MQFERWYTLDTDTGRALTVDLGAVLFEGDTDPLLLGVKLVNSDGDVAVTGEAAGRCITADGRTLAPLDGGESENTAWCIVPQDALTTPGKIEIFLRITDTSDSAVTLYAYGTVKRTSTGEIINPGTPIPNVEELQAAAQAALEAAEDAEAAAEAIAIATVAETQEYLGI